jgi:hypothetical protein
MRNSPSGILVDFVKKIPTYNKPRILKIFVEVKVRWSLCVNTAAQTYRRYQVTVHIFFSLTLIGSE